MRVIRVAELSRAQPVWVIRSPSNSSAIAGVRADTTSANLTDFDDDPIETPESACARMAWAVMEHHPDWRELEVLGATLTSGLKTLFTEAGATRIEPRLQRFRCGR